MTLTTEQKLAFTVFGILISTEPETLLNHMSHQELVDLCGEVSDIISPHVPDDLDLVTPAVDILKATVKQLKG